MNRPSKSPLRFAPLRVAGQSIDRELDDVITDQFVMPFMVALVAFAMAAVEWVRHFTNSKPNPWLLTVLAAGLALFAFIRFRGALKRIRSLRLGQRGERAVAQYLEWFRTKDFFVFHDVPNGDANIDHVLIGLRGVYVIETKTLSKPARGECKVTVIDSRVAANGNVMDRDPITQVKAQARWLYNFLSETQFKCFVQPVVVFPGWYVEPFDMKSVGVWVIEPKALDGFIDRQALSLDREQAKAMASALSSYIRSQSAL